jgi:hypothetical protein
MIGYCLILPTPWVCINLEDNLVQDVTKVVDRGAARAPKGIPPDQLAAVRRRMRRELTGDGNPDSDHTRLAVELFDAVMTTWRWHGLDA